MSIKFEEQFKYRDEETLNAAPRGPLGRLQKPLCRSDLCRNDRFGLPWDFAKR
jgi:hypothetical protein